MPPPTPAEALQARLAIVHLETVIEPSFLRESLNPPVPEPVGLPPAIQNHLDRVKDLTLPRPARLAAMRALIRIKAGQEP